jgi:hypothetical protein
LEQCIVEKNYKVNFAGPEQFEAATIPLAEWGEDGIDVAVADKADNVAGQCDKDSAYSYVSALYFKMLWNPQKEDLTSYAIECLTKLGYLPPNVTNEEYKEVFPSSNMGRVPDYIVPKAVKAINPEIFGTAYDLDTQYGSGIMIKSNGVKLPKQRSEASKQVFIPYSDIIRCNLTPKIVLEEK